MRNFLDTVNRAKSQAKYWSWAAWTLPFVALAILAFEYFIGWDTWYAKTLVITSITFFTVSVFWWWWALSKIVTLMESFHRTEQHFKDVKSDLAETRKLIKDNNVGNR
jgi:hypothetical protein